MADEEKKEYVRFLCETASAYSFDVSLMGNDMQFAQQDPADPILSKIYGTVDAYADDSGSGGVFKPFGSYLDRI